MSVNSQKDFYGDYAGQYGFRKTPEGKSPVGRIDNWDKTNKVKYSKERKFLRKFVSEIKDPYCNGVKYTQDTEKTLQGVAY